MGGAPLSVAAPSTDAVGVTTAGAPLTEAPGAAVAEPEPPPELSNIVPVPSPTLPPTLPLVVEEPLVPAPALSRTQRVQSETLQDVPAASETAHAPVALLPDFREARKELFGDLATVDSRPADV